jgi:WD40-like Beta Propeller Repeat
MAEKSRMGPRIVDTIGVLIILSFILFIGAVMEGKVKSTPFPNPAPEEKFGVISFSPDSQKLYLEFADLTGKVRSGWMDLSTRKVSLFEPQDTKDQLYAPSSSADGKQLAIVIKDAAHNFESSQIGILDLQSMTYRTITHGYGYRQFPSFSQDGKKIIYGKANLVTKDEHQIAIGWDINEADVNTGVERPLTNYCFFAITDPFYMADSRMKCNFE